MTEQHAPSETPTPRTWQMFALPYEPGDSPQFYGIGHFRFAEAHGGTPVPVVVTEDPAGDMLGWIAAGRNTPTMIQHKRIFEIQFPYGSSAEVDRHHGVVIPLRIDASPLPDTSE